MSENDVRNENTPEENVNWPTFDYNEHNWPANRLYVSELPPNAAPGVRQRRDDFQDLILKFDWYFSTLEREVVSKKFTVSKCGKKFLFRAQSSPWKEHGKKVEVFLEFADVCPKVIGLEFTAILRSPDWQSLEKLSGGQEFDDEIKSVRLYSIYGKPVDVWPVDATTELIAEMDLIPRVYAIKGTIHYNPNRIDSYFVSSPQKLEVADAMKFDTLKENVDVLKFDTLEENADVTKVDTLEENADVTKVDTLEENADVTKLDTLEENFDEMKLVTLEEKADSMKFDTLDDSADSMKFDTLEDSADLMKFDTLEDSADLMKFDTLEEN